MSLLILLGLGYLLYVFAKPKSDNKLGSSEGLTESQLASRNEEWAQFIANYHDSAQTKAEKRLIEKMLSDIAARGLPALMVGEMVKPDSIPEQSSHIVEQTPVSVSEPLISQADIAKQKQIDNASLLLYFGAFLFVASVGLFVAFGGLPGVARTLAVLLVAISLYVGGLYIFKNKPKLEQAGLAFTGIGLATAPFVGLASYNFIFNQTSGAVVWLLTSVACLGLYAHALVTLRRPILNYVLLFTILSLFESGISVINAPIYYFGWALSFIGIVFLFVSRMRGLDADLGSASYQTAQVFMPLASATAVIMVQDQGFAQLGVSFLLAALFYSFEFINGVARNRAGNAFAAQMLATIGVAALSYSIWASPVAVAVSLLIMATLVLCAALIAKKDSEITNNAASISVGFSILAIVASVSYPAVLTAAIAVVAIQAFLTWIVQERDDAYVIAVFAWMSSPLIIGQVLLNPALSTNSLVVLTLGFMLSQWLLLLSWRKQPTDTWNDLSRALHVLSGILVIALAANGSSLVVFGVCSVVALTVLGLAEREKIGLWTSFAGAFMAVPIIFWDSPAWLLVFTIIALLTNIGIALRYRQEFTRWLSTSLWFLLPVSIAQNIAGWSNEAYMWSYVVLLLVFLFSRAIARGIIFASSKVPLASYAKTASGSYVFGYVSALLVAVSLSLNSSNSQMYTSLMLVIAVGTTWLVAQKIEKAPELFVLIPLLLQALAFSIMRPSNLPVDVNLFLIISIMLAAVGYVLTIDGPRKTTIAFQALRDGSLVAAAVAPASVLFVDRTEVMMPIGLLVFTVLLYHRIRSTGQSNREWVGVSGLVGIWWLMHYFGITNIQAYTHVLAALFAAYAYIRTIRGDRETSDQYLYAMLGVATVPLLLQALGGAAGDIYGWWLLLEQVGFMLLGMAIGRSFVTRWGLYVSVGAVLYQLRSLGWAALTVLAIFLIGLAVYRLQKQDN